MSDSKESTAPEGGGQTRAVGHARKLQREGDPAAAVKLCRPLLAQGGVAADAAKSLIGMSLVQAGRREEGRCLLDQAARNSSRMDGAALCDLGGGFLLLGLPGQGVEYLEAAVSIIPEDGVVRLRMGIALALLGRFDEALEALERAQVMLPGRPPVSINLARVLVRAGRPARALKELDRVQRDYGQLQSAALEVRIEALVRLGRLEEAQQWAGSVYDSGLENPKLLRVMALVAAGRDQHLDAEAYLRQALEIASDNVRLLQDFAELLHVLGRFPEAIVHLRRAVEKEPDNGTLQILLTRLYCRVNAIELARDAAQHALEIAEGRGESDLRASALCAVAEVRHEESAFEEAEAFYRRALDLQDGHVQAHLGLGRMLMQLGRIGEAVTYFEELTEHSPTLGHAALFGARRFPDDPAILHAVEDAAKRPSMAGSVVSGLLFELAKAWEHRGEYRRAFEIVRRANEAVRPLLSYDAEANRGFTDRILSRFTFDFFRCRGGFGDPSRLPVFVLGMPRSGTTLVEQILASHPRIFGAGELGQISSWAHGLTLWERYRRSSREYPECVDGLTEAESKKMARYCLNELQSRDPSASHVVNKLPHNFQHIGLIRLLFSNAAIIHCCRDPRDVAVSNYFLDFQAKYDGMGFAYDLEDLGRHILDCRRLMEHWHRLFPGRILDVRYEELIEEPEKISRQMLGHIGVEWDERVLAFQGTDRPVKTASNWQVRQPIYKTSRGKWRRYEEFLGPLEEVLADG